jgi:tRNA threonylcarbamoyladenosine biosynthesis protein TsaB
VNLLAMDTSTRRISLAASRDGKIAATRIFTCPNLMDSNMISNIDLLLKKAAMGAEDIDGLVIGLGPGSFTGLRVGLGTAKGWAFGGGAWMIGVSSLDALAFAVRRKASTVWVITDARRDLVYHARYEVNGTRLRKSVSDRLCSIDQALETLTDGSVCVGDAVELYRSRVEAFVDKKKINTCFVSPTWATPKARYLLTAVGERVSRKDHDDPDRLVPCYLYPDDCQVRKP